MVGPSPDPAGPSPVRAPLGLLSGSGTLPALVAREARREGWRVIAFALPDAPELAAEVDRVIPTRLGEIAPILATLGAEGIRHVVLAGRVRKEALFQGMALDGEAGRLLAAAPDWSDAALFRVATGELARLGIELLDQRRFLAPWLAPQGALTRTAPTDAQWQDVRVGLAVGDGLVRHGVGQTVVVRAGTVLAVEALEGTDEAIRRGTRLGGPGAVVVKLSHPDHDYRFDVPTVGPTTLRALAEGRGAVLAVQAGRVVLLDRETLVAEAEREGITLVGV